MFTRNVLLVKITKIKKEWRIHKNRDLSKIDNPNLPHTTENKIVYLLVRLVTFTVFLLLAVDFLCLLLAVGHATDGRCRIGLGFVAAETNAAEISPNYARRLLNQPSPAHGLRRMYASSINTSLAAERTICPAARVRRVARCTFPVQFGGAGCSTRPSFGNPVCASKKPISHRTHLIALFY
jgi:hypothetical protein